MRHGVAWLVLLAVGCGGSSERASGSGGTAGSAGAGGTAGHAGGGGSTGHAGGGGSAGSGGGGELSQPVAWSIAARANALSNNLEIDVDNLYGYTVSGKTPLSAVTTLAEEVGSTLSTLSTSLCASDPKAATAASAAGDVLTFVRSLPPGGGTAAMSSAQDKKEQSLSAALRAAIAASGCVAAVSAPNGSSTPLHGDDLSSASLGASAADVTIPVHASKAYPALAIENRSSNEAVIASLKVEYADGTERTIGFGSTQTDGVTTILDLSASLGSGTYLLVDIDDRTVQTLTLVDAALDCPLPGSGGDGGRGPACSGSVEIIGLATGNGLSP